MDNVVATSSQPLLVHSTPQERRPRTGGVKAEVLANILEAFGIEAVSLRIFAQQNARITDRGTPSLTLLVDTTTPTSDVIKKLRAHKDEVVYWDIVSEPPVPIRYSISNSFSRFNGGKPMSTMDKNRALAVAGLPPM